MIMTWSRSINKMKKKNYALLRSDAPYLLSLSLYIYLCTGSMIQHRKNHDFSKWSILLYVSPNCFLFLSFRSRSLLFSLLSCAESHHQVQTQAEQVENRAKFFGWIPYRYVWLHVSYTPTTESEAAAAVAAAASVIRHLEPFRFASITFDMEESHLIFEQSERLSRVHSQ